MPLGPQWNPQRTFFIVPLTAIVYLVLLAIFMQQAWFPIASAGVEYARDVFRSTPVFAATQNTLETSPDKE